MLIERPHAPVPAYPGALVSSRMGRRVLVPRPVRAGRGFFFRSRPASPRRILGAAWTHAQCASARLANFRNV